MFGPKRQGGSGGSGFVNITGLFPTKKGNGYVGSLKPEGFQALSDLMDEAYQAGRELVFVVMPPRSENAKVAATLAVAVSQRDQQDRAPKRSFGVTRPVAETNQAPAGTATRASAPRKERVNPPADELEKFLNDYDDKNK